MKKNHLMIVFEWCHKMFLNTSKLSDYFYHWTDFAQTKQSEVKERAKKGEKIRFSAFLSCQVTEKQSSYPRKGLADPCFKSCFDRNNFSVFHVYGNNFWIVGKTGTIWGFLKTGANFAIFSLLQEQFYMEKYLYSILNIEITSTINQSVYPSVYERKNRSCVSLFIYFSERSHYKIADQYVKHFAPAQKNLFL